MIKIICERKIKTMMKIFKSLAIITAVVAIAGGGYLCPLD